MTLESLKKEFYNGEPIITYIKKNYGFQSVKAFEEYSTQLQRKAKKYDELIAEEYKPILRK